MELQQENLAPKMHPQAQLSDAEIDAQVAAFAQSIEDVSELRAMEQVAESDLMFTPEDLAFLGSIGVTARSMTDSELSAVAANEASARQVAFDYLLGRMMQDELLRVTAEDDEDDSDAE